MVSVIVPVYNVENYVAECIQSILDQTYDDLELIVVDDCGKDQSMEIVKNLFNNYIGHKSARILNHLSNRGVAAARNSGIRAANGEYTLFIDSDDYLCDQDAITKMVKRQQETGADLVTANSIMFDDVTGKIFKTVDKDYNDKFYPNNGPKQEISIGGVPWNKLIRTDFLKCNELYFDEGIVFEDTAWVFKLTCSSPRLATMSDHLYRYRYRTGSIMNTLTPHHIFSKSILPIVCYRWLKKHPPLKKTYAAVTIENLKQGGFTALIQTGNDKLLGDLYDIYHHNINISFGDILRLSHDALKLALTYLSKGLYIWIIQYNIKQRLNKDQVKPFALSKSFINDLASKITNL